MVRSVEKRRTCIVCIGLDSTCWRLSVWVGGMVFVHHWWSPSSKDEVLRAHGALFRKLPIDSGAGVGRHGDLVWARNDRVGAAGETIPLVTPVDGRRFLTKIGLVCVLFRAHAVCTIWWLGPTGGAFSEQRKGGEAQRDRLLVRYSTGARGDVYWWRWWCSWRRWCWPDLVLVRVEGLSRRRSFYDPWSRRQASTVVRYF